MANYTSAPADVESGLVEKTVVLVEKPSSTGWMGKVLGGLFIVALCLGGVMMLSFYWNRSESMLKSGQTAALTKTEADEKTDHHKTLKQISSKAKAIHLVGSHQAKTKSSKEKLEWKYNVGQAFAQGGFELVDNQIIIPETGLYFVYSQASFSVSCSDDDAEGKDARGRLTSVSHRIWRYAESMGVKDSLMSAVRSACHVGPTQDNAFRDGQGWYNAIYLGAVFRLNQGDKLWTETNMFAELETEDGKTFFGVFAL
ncbi:tumor necrosis factor b (TNF superfamily, member 2) [Pleuronectes platessa]|uniref:tumor necrosis factor b (TNF superfamily, member 2) n=1 Tax=Pleuronectes platessa TaxID=8262 RepID=UPI00232A4D8A|nr:tumor necrosis factor b (TNF superfamily, member 2) [Pleuronectes platessa]